MSLLLSGGTADITVHEKLTDGRLKELHTANGGAWGGNEVDNSYLQMLRDIFGSRAMDTFIQQSTGDYFEILRDFETKKRTVTGSMEGKMTFKIPASLKDAVESDGRSIKDLVKGSAYKDKMEWSGDKIRVQKSVAIQLFEGPIKKLVRHMTDLFDEPQMADVDAILCVGGFGECELVKAAFEKEFGNKNLIIPADAGLAVLKGAVRFGLLPEIVTLRCARYTFGREIWPAFKAGEHDESKKAAVGESTVCKKVFLKMVNIGEEIQIGKTVTVDGSAVHDKQLTAAINVYSSETSDPKYVDEEGCSMLGKLVVNLPEGMKKDKAHVIEFKFGETSIIVKVTIPKTNKTYETEIECL